MLRSRSPTTPAGSTPAATGWPRWWAACSGYLAVCDPREQSIAELADALLASRSAIAGAVNTLESLGLIRRSRAAGERMDRVRIDMSSPQAMGFDSPSTRSRASWPERVFVVLADAPPERRAILLEWAAFADFLVEQLPVLEQEWKERREALRAAGELPEAPGPAPRGQNTMTRPDQRAGDRGQGRVQVLRQPSRARPGDLTAEEGTILALLGPNGAGKTTMVRILSTLIPADSGSMQHRRPRRGHRPRRGAGASSGSPASSRPWTTCSPGPRTCG